MKKSKLIALLEKIPGDPQILFWNGMVGDWMDILPRIEGIDQVRPTAQLRALLIEHQEKKPLSAERRKELVRAQKDVPWEDNPFVKEEQTKQGHFSKRRVWVMQAKSRGIQTFDRLGRISY